MQVLEVLQELNPWHPEVVFEMTWVETTGDLDQKTSLRTLNKTNFFTKEVDQLIFNKVCRIGIHSAKDLPDPLPQGLEIIAITKGVDSSDVLVLRKGLTIDTIPSDAVIATSSERREECVRQLRKDLNFVDLRGTIGERLKKIDQDPIVGIVVAKAALLRLGYSGLNEILLPGKTSFLQGQLAVVGLVNDNEMKEIFRCIDCGVR
jgi:hydroxymethylbilane synthase